MLGQVKPADEYGLGCLESHAENLAQDGETGASAPIESPCARGCDETGTDEAGRGTTPARDGGAPPQGAPAGTCSGRDGDGVAGAYPCPIDVSRQTQYVQVETEFPDGGGFLTVRIAGCNDVECGSADFCMGCVYPSKSARPKAEPLPLDERLKLSRKRSARMIRNLVRASGLDHLLTMGAGKQLKTRQDALDAFSGYLHDPRYGRWFNDVIGGKYLDVAEPFEDGDGWHLHIALKGALKKEHLMRLKVTWTAYLYHRLGIPRPKTEKGLWRVHIAGPGRNRSPRALGRYLAKYVTKSFDASDTLGERRYRCGQGLTRPTVSRTLITCTEAEARLLFIECGRYFEVRTQDGRHIGWTGERGSPPNNLAGRSAGLLSPTPF